MMMQIVANNIRKITMLMTITFAGVAMASAVVPASAQIDSTDAAQSAVCRGLGQVTNSSGDCVDPEGSSNLSGIVASVINILSLVVGVVAVIMVIVGGMKYVTSQGDSSGTASAKNTVIYAMIGLVIVALAQVIVQFVVNRATDDTPSSSTSQPAPTTGGSGSGGSLRN